MQRLGDLLRQAMRALADNLAGERERWALWFPVAMGAGVALYFALPAEPSLLLGAAQRVAKCGNRDAGTLVHEPAAAQSTVPVFGNDA